MLDRLYGDDGRSARRQVIVRLWPRGETRPQLPPPNLSYLRV